MATTSETQLVVEKDETETEVDEPNTEVDENESEVDEPESKMTQRQFLNRMAHDLYSYCCGIHRRTYSIIDFLRDHMHDTDEKLLAFLNYVNSEGSDPRDNPLWDDDMWPNLMEGPMHDPESQEAQDASEFVDQLGNMTGKFSRYFD